MITIELDHSLTPPQLSDINRDIASSFSSGTPDYQNLNLLLAKRDECIQRHLASLDEPDRKRFAKAEIETNEKLKSMARDLLGNAKDEVTHFVRSQAAVKKYRE